MHRTRRLRALVVVLGTLLGGGTGCSAWVAMTMDGPTKDEAVRVDMRRLEVQNLLETWARTEYEQDHLTEVRYEFSDGPPKWTRLRAILWLGADVFTLFLAELLLWPMELYATDRIRRVAIAGYDDEDILLVWTVRRRDGGEVLVAKRSRRLEEYRRLAQQREEELREIERLEALPEADEETPRVGAAPPPALRGR